ncbi:hypothetical protein [Pedobacter antarcticus]|uniref:hypothetical protein n=1 Tax=Pedobacter antarcticus TaxID=34086 RepID=UPI00088D244B|nr:hypothetical protein [Pedobacter antarcticus]SDL95169.1 hypothetical protein SAMN04488084_10348 [Pedobacter antarcticus]
MNNDWLDIAILEDYLDGKLDAKSMHQVEKHALEDPFVAQALAGLAEHPSRMSQQVSLLQKQLYERTAVQRQQKKSSVFTWQRLSIGAAAAVMFITVSVIFLMRERAGKEQLAANPKKVEVDLGPVTGPAGQSLVNPGGDSAELPQTELSVAAVQPKHKPVTSAGNTVDASTTMSAPVAADVQTFGANDISDSVAVSTAAVTSKMASARIATAVPAASAPVDGWAELDTYLNDHKSVNTPEGIAKIVELSFQINAAGKPFNFKVLTSAGKALDSEAIKLLAEGPLWEKPATPETRVNYTVAF